MHPAVEGDPTRYCEDILQMVDGIYAAACGETPWEQTLAKLCEVAKLDGCALSMVEPLEQRRVVLATWGLPLAAEPTAMLGLMSGDDPQLRDRVLRSAAGAVWQDFPAKSEAATPMKPLWTDRTPTGGFGSWALVIVGRDGRKVVCLEALAAAGRGSSRSGLGDFWRQLATHLARAWRVRTTTPASRAAPLPAASSSPCDRESPLSSDLAGLPQAVRLRAEFGLTKAEARLALRLADGSSLASAARAFNVKLTTVRSQLQQVFAKTGACRQTELVAMLVRRGYGVQRSPRSASGSLPAEAEVAGSIGAEYRHAMGAPDRC